MAEFRWVKMEFNGTPDEKARAWLERQEDKLNDKISRLMDPEVKRIIREMCEAEEAE